MTKCPYLQRSDILSQKCLLRWIFDKVACACTSYVLTSRKIPKPLVMDIGLYIHIPFCKSRCLYCDFYSTTCNESLYDTYLKAVLLEITMRLCLDRKVRIGTIYMGGGTPSCLGGKRIADMLDYICNMLDVAEGAEITVEANPDDVTPELVDHLVRAGVNRVSLGAQTFDDQMLALLNRRHSAQQTLQAVRWLNEGGIWNVSLDLIYGLPGQTLAAFECDVHEVLSTHVPHVSAYSLMVEEGTPLARRVASGELTPADDELSRAMFERMLDILESEHFEQYEISNFAQFGHRSQHNSSYWKGVPYVGIGPGAHSFDGSNRRFNLPDLQAYFKNPARPPHEVEELTPMERANEAVMVSLRTKEGLHLGAFQNVHGSAAFQYVMREAEPLLQQKLLQQADGRLSLTREGIFVSDMVMSKLMQV